MSATGEPATLVGGGERKVVVLHGWLGGARSWRPMWEYLTDTEFGYAFLDARGYGTRIEEPGQYTMAEIAEDAIAEADRLGWDRFDLVGHSMGGLAAQVVLARVPDRVRGLVGVCPVPATGSPLGERAGAFRRAVRDPSARRAVLSGSTGDRHERAWYDAAVTWSMADSAPAALDGYLTSWTGTDISARITGRDNPVRVIIGDHDPAYPPERVRRTWGAFYPRCELVTVGDAGHYPMWENPGELAERIEGFLRRTDPADRADG